MDRGFSIFKGQIMECYTKTCIDESNSEVIDPYGHCCRYSNALLIKLNNGRIYANLNNLNIIDLLRVRLGLVHVTFTNSHKFINTMPNCVGQLYVDEEDLSFLTATNSLLKVKRNNKC